MDEANNLLDWDFVSIVYESVDGKYNRKDIKVKEELKKKIKIIDEYIQNNILNSNSENEIWFTLFTKNLIKEKIFIGISYQDSGETHIITYPELQDKGSIKGRLESFIGNLSERVGDYVQIVIPFWKGKVSKESLEFFSFANILIQRNQISMILEKNNIFFIIGKFMVEFQEEIQDFFWERIIQGHVKSAIATIMSRNMSHNIGSHVLNRVSENIYFEKFEDNRNLYRYLQQRMDFIAQITTEIPKWTTNHYFVKEIMSGFLRQNLLLKNIVKAEGVRGKTLGNIYELMLDDTSSNMCITVYKEDNNSGMDLNTKIAIVYKEGNKYKLDMNSLKNDLQISVPGGFIGFHALYSILENIIRNSAKHSYTAYPDDYKENFCDTKKSMDLDINIKVEKEKSGDIICEIYDNVSFISGLSYDREQSFEEYENIKIIYSNKLVDDELTCRLEKIVNKVEDEKKVEITIEEISDKCLENTLQNANNTLFYLLIDTCKLKGNRDLKNKFLDKKILEKYSNLRLIDKFHILPLLKLKKEEAYNRLLQILENLYIPLHYKLQEKLDTSFINDDGSIKQSDWGLAELKICAGFLTKRDVLDINTNGKEDDKIIEAIATTGICITDKNGNIIIEDEPVYRLGFKFKLLPPKRITILNNEKQIDTEEIIVKTSKKEGEK